MRLSSNEIAALTVALAHRQVEPFIFGSRADPQAKGGDVDVLLFSSKYQTTEERYRLALEVAVAFRGLCDEKIDVVVMDPERLTKEEQAFLGSIRRVAFPPKP